MSLKAHDTSERWLAWALIGEGFFSSIVLISSTRILNIYGRVINIADQISNVEANTNMIDLFIGGIMEVILATLETTEHLHPQNTIASEFRPLSDLFYWQLEPTLKCV
ncbi:hypothetical protein ACHAWU_008000 [Discostella pseudostelligera]|uniref:Uncharacterized protein n=1 Tax=Discostella pseudostelligera TaxID=259834 RepID=A0ABD3LZL7_9STRA